MNQLPFYFAVCVLVPSVAVAFLSDLFFISGRLSKRVNLLLNLAVVGIVGVLCILHLLVFGSSGDVRELSAIAVWGVLLSCKFVKLAMFSAIRR